MRYFCTYFDQNYLTRGLALYASLKKHCRKFQMDILCLDEECQKQLAKLSLPECRILPLTDIEAADGDLIVAKSGRTAVEYYFTLTPCLVRHLLAGVPRGEFLTYLDSDLYFFSDPQPLFQELQTGSIGIISHRFSKELNHMNMHGIYNVGWVSFRNDDLGRLCVEWWRERCLEWCYDRIEGGRYADQAYLNDWTSRFKNTIVIQNLGANVAPWNVGQHEIAETKCSTTIDGHRLIFYHFHALRRVANRVFDSQLSNYGVEMSEELRRHIYKPYLEELYRMERMLSFQTHPLKEPSASEPCFELIPRVNESGAGLLAEQTNIENYLYRKLTLTQKDCILKNAVILNLERVCNEREALIKKLDEICRNREAPPKN